MTEPTWPSQHQETAQSKSYVFLVIFSVFLISYPWIYVWAQAKTELFLLLGLALSPLILLLAFRTPYIICLFMIVFVYFHIHEVFPLLQSLQFPKMLALMTISLVIIHYILGTIKLYWCRELTLFCLFFIIVTGSTFASHDIEISYDAWINFIKIFLMVFPIVWLMGYRQSDFTLTNSLIMIVGSLIACIAIYNKLHGIDLDAGSRATLAKGLRTMLSDPNDLALVLLLPTSFSAACLITAYGNKANRIISLFSLPLCVWGIITTQSRGGLLSLLSIFFMISYFKFKSKKLAAFLTGILLVFLYIVADIAKRQSGGTDEIGLDTSSLHRLYAWYAAISMGLHNPIFGVGIKGYVEHFYDFTPVWIRKNMTSHSTWFGVLAEAGFIGFFLFLAMIGSAWRSIHHSFVTLHNPNSSHKVNGNMKSFATAVYASLISFCVAGTFLGYGFIVNIYIIIALTIVLRQYLKNNAQDLNKL